MLILVVVIGCVITIKLNNSREPFVNDNDKFIIDKLKEKLMLINPALAEIPIFPGDESVTVDKKKVYVCMKDENGMYYNIDTLFYVVLHEMAHMLSKSYSTGEHNKEFQLKFKELLQKAYALGLLPDRQVVPLNYCKKELKRWFS
jgi:hypothetical protein